MKLRQRLDEIRTLAEKATPGEWKLKVNSSWVVFDRIGHQILECEHPNDAALIAAMRNALPALLDVVEAQHRALSDSLMVLSGEELSKNALIDALTSTRAALSLMDKEKA